jgi:lysozyme family protein
MASGNFLPCLNNFTLRPDFDGQGPHKTPGDSGGWTAFGVIFQTWAAWQASHGRGHQTIAEFQLLTQADVAPIYRAWFWDAQHCDDWPLGVDLCVFDFGVGSGPGTSIKVLQSAVGVEADGVVGAVTRAAVAAVDPAMLIARLTHQDAEFYAHCAGAGLFLRGWDRRNDARCAEAAKMAHEMITGGEE